MGWKTLKEQFGIKHSVQVTKEGICIGSSYAHDLAVVNTKTGQVQENCACFHFLPDNYPALLNTSTQEILRLVQAVDTFSTSISVYTYEGGEIIEKLCETPGWPNVTHDGCMMYNNTFSTDKAQVVSWAKENAAAAIEHKRRCIADAETELSKLMVLLANCEADSAKLEMDYPDVTSSAI